MTPSVRLVEPGCSPTRGQSAAARTANRRARAAGLCAGSVRPGITSTWVDSLDCMWASRPLSMNADEAGGEQA